MSKARRRLRKFVCASQKVRTLQINFALNVIACYPILFPRFSWFIDYIIWEHPGTYLTKKWKSMEFFRKFKFVTYNFCNSSAKMAISLKFIYSEKAIKFCEISTNYLTCSTHREISQNFVAFSEYMNFSIWSQSKYLMIDKKKFNWF
jgi:hypothetical protein